MKDLRIVIYLGGWLSCVLLLAVVAFAMATGPSVSVSSMERWIATSTTSMAITGDVSFSAQGIKFFNGTELAFSSPELVVSFTDSSEPVEAAIYRLAKPIDVVLKNGSHLCGSAGRSKVVTFIAVWKPAPLPGDKAPRSLAVFSGDEIPRSTSDPESCGVYNYEVP